MVRVRTRLFAFLLCAALLFGFVPAQAAAFGEEYVTRKRQWSACLKPSAWTRSERSEHISVRTG